MKKGNKTEINCLQLLTVVRSAWKQLLITCICSAVIGIVVAFSIPRIYKARVVLAPETASGTNLTSSISSLASMIGMDMQFGGGSDAIFPEIYPDLMKSTDFLVSLFPIHVVSADGKISTNYYDYMKDWQKVAWWSYPKLWIIKVIRSLQDKGNDTKGKEIQKGLVRNVTLIKIDEHWKQHLRDMDDLKQSVQNATYEQKDPLVIYKFEGYNLFSGVIENISRDVISFLVRAQVALREDNDAQLRQEASRKKTDMSRMSMRRDDGSAEAAAAAGRQERSNQPVHVEKKVGRNDPCPCGSGKKFKNCHGKGLV